MRKKFALVLIGLMFGVSIPESHAGFIPIPVCHTPGGETVYAKIFSGKEEEMQRMSCYILSVEQVLYKKDNRIENINVMRDGFIINAKRTGSEISGTIERMSEGSEKISFEFKTR